MREKYIFFIGLGVGIVFTSLVGFFVYNLSINKIDLEKNIEETKDITESLIYETTTMNIDTITEQTTIGSTENTINN